MKRTVVLFLGLFLCFGLMAQSNEETKKVKPPVFNQEEATSEEEELKKSGFCCYFQENFDCPEINGFEVQEGTVVVDFVVDTAGEVQDVAIKNCNSRKLRQAIRKCLASTSGRWEPGSLNQKPVAMAKRFYIRVDVPGNESHEEIAAYHLRAAQALYLKGDLPNLTLRKSIRYFKRARRQLSLAMRYCPDSYDMRLWDHYISTRLDMEPVFAEYFENRDPAVHDSEDLLSRDVETMTVMFK
jgi:hypothetical protein